MERKEFYWLNKNSRDFLAKGYLQNGQSAEDRVREIGDTAERYLKEPGFSDKFYKYMSLGYYSLATPIWCNFGKEKGLGISCNQIYIEDTTASILKGVSEIGIMSKHGAGTAVYFGSVRGRGTPISDGGTSIGTVPFMQIYEQAVNTISQGASRRGHSSIYLPVEHPDILEFLEVREEGHPIQHLSLGVCISDKWMEDLEAGKPENVKIWRRIIRKRFETGFPYIFWTDTVNNAAPIEYKNTGRKIWSSQMCSEIALSSSPEESFVCDLSSMNVYWYDEWKDTDAVQVLTRLLDAVMEEYIEKTESLEFMEKARNFAINQRALGVGILGWHSFLQKNMIPFDSLEANLLNVQIAKFIQEKTIEASKDLAQRFGEPPLLKGSGRRNITLQAIAPTTSSAFILGQISQSIEPWDSNYFIKDVAKGKYTIKNQELKKLLKSYGKHTDEVWASILDHGGSVQHLDFLTEREKEVFKTFGEISQKAIAIQAVSRQKFIDQSQSLNFMIDPNTPLKDVSELMKFCWKNGIKTLYYQHGTNASQALQRNLLNCSSCEA